MRYQRIDVSGAPNEGSVTITLSYTEHGRIRQLYVQFQGPAGERELDAFLSAAWAAKLEAWPKEGEAA